MSYKIRKHEICEDAFRRIIKEQLQKTVRECVDPRSIPETVRQVRLNMFRVRALLKLFRYNLDTKYKNENAWFKNASHILSTYQEVDVLRDTLHSLKKWVGRHSYRAALKYYSTKLARMEKEEHIREKLLDLANMLRDKAGRTQTWKLKDCSLESLENGYRKTYSKARKKMRASLSLPTPKNYDAWRKHARAHLFQVRLLGQVYPEMKKNALGLEKAVSLLDQYHQLNVFRKYLSGDIRLHIYGKDVLHAIEAIDRKTRNIDEQLQELGRRMYDTKPGKAVKRTLGKTAGKKVAAIPAALPGTGHTSSARP